MALHRSAGTIFQLKVKLDGISPPIWRRILVPGYYTLPHLHITIQRCMGWQNYHLYAFERRRVLYLDPAEWEDIDSRDRDGSRITVKQMFTRVGQRLTYLYDMGDDWHHTIVFEGLSPKRRCEFYPQCLDGKRHCPLEDSGGISGYQELLRVLADPEDEEYESMNEWARPNFDPERFDLAKTQQRLLPRFRPMSEDEIEEEWWAARNQ